MTLLAALGGLSCLGATRGPDLAGLDESTLSARIEELELQIEADRATLETLVTRPRTPDSPPLHEDAALREIASRLSDRAHELERLHAERARR